MKLGLQRWNSHGFGMMSLAISYHVLMPPCQIILPLFLSVFNLIIHQYAFAEIFTVRRVHWLRAQAQKHRWDEECTLVRYEMEWTVRYFLHKSRFWQSAPTADLTKVLPGQTAYAQRKAAMWDKLARDADHSFKNINKNYKSPL